MTAEEKGLNLIKTLYETRDSIAEIKDDKGNDKATRLQLEVSLYMMEYMIKAVQGYNRAKSAVMNKINQKTR